MASPKLPNFDRLPKVEGMPQGCAWGLFDKGGKKDALGTINLLTPDVVKAAVSEVKEGVSVSLKYEYSAANSLYANTIQLANWRNQETRLRKEGPSAQSNRIRRGTFGLQRL
jgi:hypothetical protein